MNADGIEIRNAKLADLQDIQQFLKPFVAVEQILPRTDDELSVLIMHGFVAEKDEEIVGFSAVEIYSKKLAEIQSIAVSPPLQGKGLATELVRRCVERAESEGVLELMAITASESPFRSVGFDYSLPNQKRALFLQTRSKDKISGAGQGSNIDE